MGSRGALCWDLRASPSGGRTTALTGQRGTCPLTGASHSSPLAEGGTETVPVSCPVAAHWDIWNNLQMEGNAICIFFNQEFYSADLFGKINTKVKNYSLPVKKTSADLDC